MTNPPAYGPGARAQRGVVLFIALIVLVAMALASVALIRSVDTATLGAGNIILRHSAAQAAERAIGAAMLKFDPDAAPPGFFTTVTNADSHQALHNYCAILEPTDARGLPLVLVNGGNKACDNQPLNAANLVTTPNNETLRFVIDRLCTQTGTPQQDRCTVDTVLPTGGTVGSGPALGATAPLYRVSVRVDGPRNTIHYAQVILKR